MSRAADDRRALPAFATLRAFEAVGTLRGIRRAALALHLDHAVVSRHVRSLEEWAGVRLVERVRGNVSLTEHGMRFHGKIAAALLAISDATAELISRAHEQRLQISCVPGFASQWLAGRLATFQAANPGVEIELHPTDHGPDFTRYEADIDIRYIPGTELVSAAFVRGGIRKFELARPPVYAVTSPKYAAVLGPINGAGDLVGASLLHEENDSQFRAWFSAQGVQVAGTIRGPRMWHADVAIEAARRGQGIALANPFLLGDDFETGRLVNLLPSAASVTLGAYVLSARADSWHAPCVAQFRRWIKNVISGKSGSGRVAGPSSPTIFIADDEVALEEPVNVFTGASA
jgi:LysR family transcriptional regulator, glycine cleavage system transcriptional activator